MIIGLSSDGKLPDSKIAKRFGHAEYILLYDTETCVYTSVINEKEHSHKDLEKYISSGVKVFIVGNIGPNSFYTLKENEAKIFLARNMKVKDAVSTFIKNELLELSEPTLKKSFAHSEHSKHDARNNEENHCHHEGCENHNNK